MEADVFAPFGMRDTGLDHNDKILANRALGYEYEKGSWTPAAYVSMTVPYAAGSLTSTIDDMLRWDRALDTDRLIGPSLRQAMFTNHGGGYGFGWGIGGLSAIRVQFHTGAISGFHAIHCRYPDHKLTIIVLANVWTGFLAERIANDLASSHLGMLGWLPRRC